MSVKQIVVTGAYGFIGCNLVKGLNKEGFDQIIIVDDFSIAEKKTNLDGLRYTAKIERTLFPEWLTEHHEDIAFIFHLGARTDTTEFNFRILDSLNLSYSKALFEIATVYDIPILYASSAATYGMGENGFIDDENNISQLQPLNPYGVSKQLFDMYVLAQKNTPTHWWGLKFFNVYGEHEAHKKRMASVVFHAYQQIKKEGNIRLFESHNPDYANGEQLRDFIYVKDIVAICLFIFKNHIPNGIYNAGTGKARAFNDLAVAVFSALSLPEAISYIPTPIDIRDKYQYFTEADMTKLITAGYDTPFTSLEEGVKQYISFLENA